MPLNMSTGSPVFLRRETLDEKRMSVTKYILLVMELLILITLAVDLLKIGKY